MQPIYQFSEFRLETAERRLLRNGVDVPLAPKVFDTLVVLLENAGRLLPKDELMEKLWPNTFVEEVSLAQNISQLRKALGEGAEGVPLIQTVAKRGYRFAVPVQIVTDNQPTAVQIVGDERRLPIETGNRATPSAGFRWKLGLGIAAVALVALLGFLSFPRRSGKAATPAIRSIAVLPLANLSTDPGEDFFADGVTDDLITELARIRALRVISRTSVMQYKGTRKTLPQIAHELKVDALVEGTISQRNGRIHITTQLVQADPEQHIWAESYERPLEKAQNLQSEIAREIAAALKTSMTPDEQAAMRKSRSASPEANLLYLKGRYFWNKRTVDGVKQSEKLFREAVEKDGSFAKAYVGLADAYVFEGGWGMQPANVVLPRAEAAAQQAIALDPEDSDAHATLGLIAMNYEWDWRKAEREYKQALRLNPNNATAHHWYAEYLAAQGRFQESLAEIDHALEIDPLSLAIASDRGKVLYFGRRYDEAIVQLHKTLEMDPHFEQAHYWLIRAYANSGKEHDAETALSSLHQVVGDGPQYWSNVSMVKARAGRQREVTDAAAMVLRYDNSSLDPALMLEVQLATGDAQRAFSWMDQCYAAHSVVMTSLKVNPDYDGLRSDPRFKEYLDKVGLAN